MFQIGDLSLNAVFDDSCTLGTQNDTFQLPGS